MSTVSKVSSVHVRLEGDSNRDWTVKFKDGSEQRFYSIEGSPRDSDDEIVHEYNQPLSILLEKFSEVKPLQYGPGNTVLQEYDLDPETGLITNVQQAFEYTNYELKPTGLLYSCQPDYFKDDEDLDDSDYRVVNQLIITSVEFKDGKLIVRGVDSVFPEAILAELYCSFRPKVLEFLNSIGFRQFIDWDEYEGGVSEWWGMGSVTLMELGINFNFEFSGQEYTLTISK